ncbi:triacylglycerol lipase [Nocardia cyriacigeorgica]|uniref:Triacylglycerol lipase n=1 Tax=Nocardia cyriacigeorgica TaxID=135487 RepID=A0A5R8NY89_9NOCA|nr:triacylglycerol lipase [Nocardia cyriacigeorgica]
MAVVAVAACVAWAGGGAAAADPAFPPSFPPDQNQLPSLPSEADVYEIFPLPDPRSDPWYAAPPDLATMSNGQIVRTRDVGAYTLGIPIPVAARQILYRSTDSNGRPLVTATTVLTPGIPWIGSPRPLISYQEAIDSLAPVCNPSYTLRAGTFKEIALLQYYLEQGMAVAVPDFNGQANTWLSKGEGHMVLDGIRAAKSDPALGLQDSAVGLYGYSGGGSATVWAAELHRSYAPELRILGAAAGGVPAEKNDILALNASAEAGFATWTMWPLLAALAREFPDIVRPEEILTGEGQAILRDVQDRCAYTIGATGMFRPLRAYLAQPDALDDPRLRALLDEQTPGRSSNRPDMPLAIFHSTADQLLPKQVAVQPLINRYCRAGVDLRYLDVPLSEHFIASVTASYPAMVWLSLQMRGGPPGPRICP